MKVALVTAELREATGENERLKALKQGVTGRDSKVLHLRAEAKTLKDELKASKEELGALREELQEAACEKERAAHCQGHDKDFTALGKTAPRSPGLFRRDRGCQDGDLVSALRIARKYRPADWAGPAAAPRI